MNTFNNRYLALIMLLCAACGNNAPAGQETARRSANFKPHLFCLKIFMRISRAWAW